MTNIWQEALHNLQKAASAMNLEADLLERLSTPMRFTEFTIPVRLDNGQKKLFTAYRSWHQDATGPTRDGTRIRPDLTPEEIKALSLFMSIKHAVGGIRAGGAKGGIRANPATLSAGEFERLVRGFMRRLAPKGAQIDVPGADLGTGEQAMAWMLDEYEQINGFHSPAALNDKPFALGGSLGGFEATGWGVAECTDRAARTLKLTGGRVSIMGFGQVGSIAALTLFEMGYKICAISDIYGSIVSPDGINVPELVASVAQTGKVAGFKSLPPSTNILEQDCDILIPAAVENVINENNASRLKAKLVVEAANGPTTFLADEILQKAGVVVVPDVVANCGGAIVCDFERTQCLSNDYWTLDQVRKKLSERIGTAYQEAEEEANRQKGSLRLGAWINALNKIRAAMNWRGWC